MAVALPVDILVALNIVYRALRVSRIAWAITGSVGFALQDLPLGRPNDLDLQTSASGAYEIESHLAEYVVIAVRFTGNDRIRSHLGTLNIGGVKVEIMGDVQHRLPDDGWSSLVALPQVRRYVAYAGMQLPVMSLVHELNAYRLMGRETVAQELGAWLSTRSE